MPSKEERLSMLTERLKAALESAEQLPPDAQEELAQAIERAIDNAIWKALLADPRSGPVLDEMIEEAKRGPLLPFPTPADMGDEVEDDE
jgi:hypothetical protein